MLRRFLIVAMFVLKGLSSTAHPVHVSLCNLEIEEGKMTVAVKLFLDDFQLALQHNFGKIIPYEELGSPENKNLVDRYISNTLQIVMNKKDSVRLIYDTTEKNEIAIWFYYHLVTEEINELDVKNALLLDIYSDQTNLLIVRSGENQSGYRFTFRDFEQYIELK